jgi:nucleotide-binding universal stress UspA family protein
VDVRIVVGVSPDESGSDAVALGAVLSRLLGGALTVAYVHPPTVDYPSVGNVDAEWAEFLRERGDATLAGAAAQLAGDWGIVDVERMTVANASVSRGLRETARDLDASLIVIGPDTGGRDGRLALGSIAHSLLHGGETAVALAPEGYRETAPDAIGRVVVGFRDTREAIALVSTALEVGGAAGIPVELLTVVLRSTRIVGARAGRDPERAVMDSLVERERAAQAREISTSGGRLTGKVVRGDTAEQGMMRFSWQSDDLLVVGSSRFGALRRVFLGDTTHKLLRACSVPAIVMPREPGDLTAEIDAE